MRPASTSPRPTAARRFGTRAWRRVVVAICLGAAWAAGGCRERPPPEVQVLVDAGPRLEQPLADCRTHRANLQTGEVTRASTAFARFEVDGGLGVLREGTGETFRARLIPDASAPPSTPAPVAPSMGVVLGHQVVALSAGRLVGLDRATGKESWARPSTAEWLLAIPGDLALAAGPRLAVAYRGKTGQEVFRVALPADTLAPAVVDDRLVVFRRPTSPGQKTHLVVVDPPLAKGAVLPKTPERRDLELDAPLVGVGVFGARAAHGDFFVVTTREIQRIAHGGADGERAAQPRWRAEVPFANARAFTVLDLEELIFVAAYDDAQGGALELLAYAAKGEDASELRELFRVTLPPHPSPGPCAREVALGQPDHELVVASRCGESSVVTVLAARTGVVLRRLTHP